MWGTGRGASSDVQRRPAFILLGFCRKGGPGFPRRPLVGQAGIADFHDIQIAAIVTIGGKRLEDSRVRRIAALIGALGLFACTSPMLSLQQKPTKEQQLAANVQVKAAVDALTDELRQMCSRDDLQPYYSKTPCLPAETTIEQMADESRITDAEKVALNKVRVEVAQINKKMDDIIRQYDPKNADAIITRRERAVTEQNDLALEFYEGRTTRGEYNRQRAEITKRLKDDWTSPGR